MAQIPHDELKIVSLHKRDKLTSFKSISSELNDFLKNDALKDQESMLSKTYLCFWKENLAGFVTLLADTIGVESIHESECVSTYQYKKYPAVKIGRIATADSLERMGIGRFMLLFAIGKSVYISKEIGCRYITVDSKLESIDFYKKLHFKSVAGCSSSDFPKMYLNMHPIIKKMEPKESFADFKN